MGDTTAIQWCDYTFNPWIGCEKVSAGCKNCYASVDTYARVSASRGLPLWGPGSSRHHTSEANWRKPRAWNRKAREQREERTRLAAEVPWQRPRVFCASLADVFEGRADLDPVRADLWRLIEECTELDWLLLTKRPENVREMVPSAWVEDRVWGYPIPFRFPAKWPSHVWLGASVENQEQGDARIPHLLQVPAPVRFLSMEPLLGPVDLSTVLCPGGDLCNQIVCRRHVEWLIVGGESGPGARPCDVAWIRDLVRQGREAGVATFVKQGGACFSDPVNGIAGRSLVVPPEGAPLIARRLRDPKGGDLDELPEDLRVREFPKVSP